MKSKMNRASSRIMKAAIAKCNADGLEFRGMELWEASGDASYVQAQIRAYLGLTQFTLEVKYSEHKAIAGQTWSVQWSEPAVQE